MGLYYQFNKHPYQHKEHLETTIVTNTEQSQFTWLQ